VSKALTRLLLFGSASLLVWFKELSLANPDMARGHRESRQGSESDPDPFLEPPAISQSKVFRDGITSQQYSLSLAVALEAAETLVRVAQTL
jgi:hypothetical protein